MNIDIFLFIVVVVVVVHVCHAVRPQTHRHSMRHVIHQLERDVGIGVRHNGSVPLPGHPFSENPPVDSSVNRPPPPPLQAPPPRNQHMPSKGLFDGRPMLPFQEPKQTSPFTRAKSYEMIKAHRSPAHRDAQLKHKSTQMTVNGKNVRVYVAVVGNPVGYFGFVPSSGSATERDWGNATRYHCEEEAPTRMARENGCLYATNGGFFDMNSGQCLGSFAHKGVLLQLDTSSVSAIFGITKGGSIVSGYLSGPEVIGLEGGFEELLTGRGWLIRDGRSCLNASIEHEHLDNKFVTEEAPRTGIAFDSLGRLVLIQVDGEEDTKVGCNLHEFTTLMQQLNVTSAVNLDGGGSSVSLVNGTVVSRPTCDDTKRICTRNIPTITCVT